MKKFILTSFLVTIISFNAFAGPFGIEMGMSLQEVTKISTTTLENLQEDVYLITPPNTNDLFEQYVIRVDPTFGVYWIKAVGKNISTTGYGTALKSTFNDLVSSIEGIYGKYKKIDYLEYGSIWDEPKDFMMGLVKQERSLIACWDLESGATLPSNIDSIYVGANALNSSEGYVALEYYSSKYKVVKEAKKAKQSTVF